MSSNGAQTSFVRADSAGEKHLVWGLGFFVRLLETAEVVTVLSRMHSASMVPSAAGGLCRGTGSSTSSAAAIGWSC